MNTKSSLRVYDSFVKGFQKLPFITSPLPLQKRGNKVFLKSFCFIDISCKSVVHPSLTILLILLSLSATLLAQETELDKRNGFKDIKMATPIDSIKGAKFKKDFKEKGHHPAKLYTIEHPDYQTIGEVKVERIEAKAYKGLIYEISVVTEKDTRLMKGMESALGKPIYNVRDESYNWTGKNLGLKFKSLSKSQLELLYTSTVMHKMMREDKDKKIDDIADDF